MYGFDATWQFDRQLARQSQRRRPHRLVLSAEGPLRSGAGRFRAERRMERSRQPPGPPLWWMPRCTSARTSKSRASISTPGWQTTDLGTIRPTAGGFKAGYKLAGLNLDLPLINNLELVGRYDTRRNDALTPSDHELTATRRASCITSRTRCCSRATTNGCTATDPNASQVTSIGAFPALLRVLKAEECKQRSIIQTMRNEIIAVLGLDARRRRGAGRAGSRRTTGRGNQGAGRTLRERPGDH